MILNPYQVTEKPSRAVIGLHGWTGDEYSMESIAISVKASTAKRLMPRAPYEADTGEGYTWFSGSDETGWKYEKTLEMAGVQKELETMIGFPITGTILSRFIKIGNHGGTANLWSASTAYDAYSAKTTYNAKMYLFKILNDKAHEITQAEEKAIAERIPSWANNRSMMETIVSLKGGNVILQQLVGEHDLRKRIWLAVAFKNWARKVGIDIPK